MIATCDFDSADKDWKLLYLAAIGENDARETNLRRGARDLPPGARNLLYRYDPGRERSS